MKKRGAGQKEGEGQDKSGIVFKMRRTRRERNRDKKEEPVYDCVIYGFFFFLSGHVFCISPKSTARCSEDSFL